MEIYISKTFTIELQAGDDLVDLFPENIPDNKTSLEIIGTLGVHDIAFLRKIFNSDYRTSLATIYSAEVAEAIAYMRKSIYGNITEKVYSHNLKELNLEKARVLEYDNQESVDILGERALCRCANLESIILPSYLKCIGKWAISDCKKLKKIKFNKVDEIECFAFSNCESLIDCELPESIINLEGLFYGCKSMKNINIPSSCTEIGMSAFWECEGLESFNVPNFIRTINNQAFGFCINLKKIIFPESLISLGHSVFQECKNIQEIHCHSKIPPKILINERWMQYSSSSFNPNVHNSFFMMSNKSRCKIFVPYGSLRLYKNSFGWNQFVNFIEF